MIFCKIFLTACYSALLCQVLCKLNKNSVLKRKDWQQDGNMNTLQRFFLKTAIEI